MFRVNTHNLYVGENTIFMPEGTSLSDVKYARGKLILVTLDPMVWGRAESRTVMVLSNKKTVEADWDYIGSAVMESSEDPNVLDVVSVFDATNHRRKNVKSIS